MSIDVEQLHRELRFEVMENDLHKKLGPILVKSPDVLSYEASKTWKQQILHNVLI